MLDFFNNLPNWVKGILVSVSIVTAATIISKSYILDKDTNTISSKEDILVGLTIKNQQKLPLEDVKVEFNFTGAPSTKMTDDNGYVQINISKRNDIKIFLSKNGYKNKNYILNLLTDPETNKEIELESESPSTQSKQSSKIDRQSSVLVSSTSIIRTNKENEYGLDIEEYCKYKYGSSFKTNKPTTVYNWYCEKNNVSYLLERKDFKAACQQQHNTDNADYRNKFDPYSWYCRKN